MKKHAKNQDKLTGRVSKSSPLFKTIDSAYRVFKQPKPRNLGVCDCCMYPEYMRDFFNYSQRDIPLDYIKDWFFAAADTPLDQNVWRYLLPRILEVLASGEDPSNIGMEVSLNRFSTGDRAHWTKQEWSVLDSFQKLFLSRFDLRGEDALDDIICMFANAGWEPELLFSQVNEWPTEKIIEKLWSDWCEFSQKTIWITPFWENQNLPWDFYTSEKLNNRITDYALDESTDPQLAEKAMAISDLMLEVQ